MSIIDFKNGKFVCCGQEYEKTEVGFIERENRYYFRGSGICDDDFYYHNYYGHNVSDIAKIMINLLK